MSVFSSVGREMQTFKGHAILGETVML